MKPALLAAFVLPVLCCSPGNPQQTSPQVVPASLTTSDTKAATQPADAVSLPAGTPVAEILAPQVTEEELRQKLVGKQLFLRGLWLDDELHFNVRGELTSSSSKGSFTLCAVEIEKVHLTKRRLDLEGARYGMHFAGEAEWENQATSFDRIRVTPKKKHLLITIDRQVVVEPKKKKEESEKGHSSGAAPGKATPEADLRLSPLNSAAVSTEETTTNPAESAEHLRFALNRIFAPALDAAMIAHMPDYWQYFYQAQLEHKSIEPTDPSIVHPGPGVKGPMLVKNIVPASNEFAQRGDIAGVASYKIILGPDGKPLAVACFTPIGFGLDENAVEAIRKSSFTPAIKDGKPVTSIIDMAVNFRIYSNRTAEAPAAQTADAPETPGASPITGKAPLPGIYSANAAQR